MSWRYLLPHGLDESAQRAPDHDALRFKGASLTYGDLAQRSNQLAHCLVDRGIRRGDRVGVFLNKSFETVIAIYGIMKAGAAYVPLDPASPADRVTRIIEDCALRGIVSEARRLPVLREVDSAQSVLQFVIGLDTAEDTGFTAISWQTVATFPADTPPAVRVLGADLAYIMYTSGSTGQPKGIMHTHDSGLSYVRLSAATYGVRPDDRLSNHSPLHFDMSTFDYLTSLYCGATTIIIPETYTLFPVNLSKLIADERLTIWYSVPFALIQLAQRGELDQRDLSSLRWILYGGEPFPRSHIRALAQYVPDARFSNVYGPAEVNQCTYYHLPPPDQWLSEDEPVPLGDIWHNAEGLILDADDQPITDDTVGELVVRAPTMMQGYWQRPDLNQRAFYHHPITSGYDATYYRTGDLVRRDAAGLLHFLGRKDHQVKVRGYRVELSEVENALNSHEAVEESAAFLIRDPDGDQIWAAIITADGHTPAERDLLAHAAQHLPRYAIPQRLRFEATFPRGGTGKVDRRALQTAAQADHDAGHT